MGPRLFRQANCNLRKDDLIYFVSTEQGKDIVIEYAGRKSMRIKNLLVIGGSRTGKYIAMKLSNYYNIKLIDKDIGKCAIIWQKIFQECK